ncbi:MAG: hypothetical protein H0X64_05710 [Gemmatimonadaceae bacterium]|nr:hypothetical protein [Gemmatimonadaceae bacterium]
MGLTQLSAIGYQRGLPCTVRQLLRSLEFHDEHAFHTCCTRYSVWHQIDLKSLRSHDLYFGAKHNETMGFEERSERFNKAVGPICVADCEKNIFGGRAAHQIFGPCAVPTPTARCTQQGMTGDPCLFSQLRELRSDRCINEHFYPYTFGHFDHE